MGREIKRVAAGFDWPIDVTWTGYVSPYHAQKCEVCDGYGLNPATKLIEQSFYAHDMDPALRWRDKITQDEVQALADAGRLNDFTHNFIPGQGWVKKDPPCVPTAEEVNAANRSYGVPGRMGHDAINRWILVETRAKRLGVYGECAHCKGEGSLWFSEEIKAAAEAWEPRDPPSGDWWQVWQTVGDGSPLTPAFATREELIDYLVEGGDAWDRSRGSGGWSRKSAEAFVGRGFAPSLLVMDGVVREPRDTLAEVADAP